MMKKNFFVEKQDRLIWIPEEHIINKNIEPENSG